MNSFKLIIKSDLLLSLVSEKEVEIDVNKDIQSTECDLFVTDTGRFCNQLFEYMSLFVVSKFLPRRLACISEVGLW